MRGAVNLPAVVPTGVFAGQPPAPQDPATATATQLLGGMAGDPGVRLAGTTDRHSYSAADLSPQDYLTSASQPNDDGAIADAPLMVNSRNAMPHHRGVPS